MSIPSVKDKNQNNAVLYSQNTIHNDSSIKNKDDIQSCETPRNVFRITTISTPDHNTQCFATTSSSILNLNTPTTLPPIGKEYMCFQKYGKTALASRCIKLRIMTKVIYSVILIDTFEQQYVVLKGTLQ